MPPENPTASDSREIFLLGQQIWRAEGTPAARWRRAIQEDEPSDDQSKGESAFRPPPPMDEVLDSESRSTSHDSPSRPGSAASTPDTRLGESSDEKGARWVRISRDEVVQHAISDELGWRRVGLVCGAGLGKTTNLEWVGVQVNRRADGRAKELAVRWEVRELPSDQDQVKARLLQEMRGHDRSVSAESVERMLVDGRVTWLLDSLDQADPDPKGDDVAALKALSKGRYSACRIWVSGRPYAFRLAAEALAPLGAWQFLRIGELEEAECRHLLEVAGRPRPSEALHE